MSSPEPYLSVVVASRNDDHGGNLLERMQLFTDGFIGQCRRHRLNAELIIVEWNPPADRPRLAEALRWPADLDPCRVRIIEVPAALHRRHRHSRSLPLFQMIAKNVGIRRARGQFILATNIDILFSDELMAFLAAGKLEPGRLYRIDRHDVQAGVPSSAPLDQQLAWCRSHLLRLNAREGTFRLTPEGEYDLSPCDICSPNVGIRLGTGWFPPESYEGLTWRWAANDAVLIVENRPELPRIIAMEIEPGPGVNHRPFLLQVRDQQDRIVAHGTVAERQIISFRLPEAAQAVERYILHVVAGDRPTPNDWRILNFRVFDCQRVEDWQDESEAPAGGNLAIRSVPPELRSVLETDDIAAREMGIRFGPGWHPVEAYGGGRFRWAANQAALVLSPDAPTGTLTLAVEPGPAVGYQPFTLQVRGPSGEVIASCPVTGESLTTLELPVVQGKRLQAFTLCVEGEPQPAPSDSRVLSYRVFAPIYPGRPAFRLTRRLVMKKVMRLLGPALSGWIKNLAQKWAQWRQGRPTVPPIETSETDAISPPPLHLNACGDFTLLAREHWFDLRGYPEFEAFSLHIDSLFCFQAHQAGAVETVLADPMRIYHIEHAAGSGWTPEGENQLMQRIEAKGIPVLRSADVFGWAKQMRRQGSPLRFNRGSWGLAEDRLPETVIGTG